MCNKKNTHTIRVVQEFQELERKQGEAVCDKAITCTTPEVYTRMRLRNRDLMKSWKRKKEAYKDRKRAEAVSADKKK